VARSDYGPLSEDLSKALTQLRRGRVFEDALASIAKDAGSPLFKRCVIIINDAKKSGAGLADVMNAIADDARDVNRVRRERVTRTVMHVIFIYASSLLLSPFIFGFTLTIVQFIGAGISCAVPGSSVASLDFTNSLLIVFLTVEALIAAMAIGVIQSGRMLQHISRAPVMVLISIVIYEIGKRVGTMIVGGGSTC
jgi:archaellum biogenesis protein FlaJ (TadC family)